ncbi:patatin-like phospholipase family protein [Methylocapsa sp. S129]|uniref:patatin-like phospholipase family protein n=1 Tax=Methylocapsa sp. S129 TaxID=1641869 RepID=UPI00131AEC32|nr:patatin-like phospholipase family protein [Methylocapsa sp. S129]
MEPARQNADESSSPSIAIALGGGGARGIAHIAILEALDELGVKPRAMSGTSIGAILGAAYAAGIEAKHLRAHTLAIMRKRSEVMGKLLKARVGRFTDIVLRGFANPVLLDAELFLDLFWPDAMPERFEDLAIPLQVVTTDFYDRCEAVFSTGLLSPAVAGSMAIPGLIKPVEMDGRVLIDGGAVNPLPYDLLFEAADIVIAIDVTFGGPRQRRNPAPFEAMFGAAQIMQGAITSEKLKLRAPDILMRPMVEQFRVLDFFRAAQILRAAESAKEDIKRKLAALLDP